MKEMILNEKAWIYSEGYTFKEELDPKTNRIKSFKLIVDALPLGKISSNGILYNVESVRAKLGDWAGKPFCDNHTVDGSIRATPPFGHVEKAWITDDDSMMKAQIDIDPAEEMFIRKAKRKDIGTVSIQVLGDRVVERYDETYDKPYTEASIGRVLELSAVLVPGFEDAKMQSFEALICERFGGGIKTLSEDINTSTADGAIAPATFPKKKKEALEDFGDFPMEMFHVGLKTEMEEHPAFKPLDAAQLVVDHLKEDVNYYVKDDSEETKEAKEILEKLGTVNVKKLMDSR